MHATNDMPLQDATTLIGYMSSLLQFLTTLPNSFSALAPVMALVHRVGQLELVLRQLHQEQERFEMRGCVQEEEHAQCISLQRLTCTTPSGQVLCRELSMHIERGQSVVVMGPSGCGKSSLLRVLGGLWTGLGTCFGMLFADVRNNFEVSLKCQKYFITD